MRVNDSQVLSMATIRCGGLREGGTRSKMFLCLFLANSPADIHLFSPCGKYDGTQRRYTVVAVSATKTTIVATPFSLQWHTYVYVSRVEGWIMDAVGDTDIVVELKSMLARQPRRRASQ